MSDDAELRIVVKRVVGQLMQSSESITPQDRAAAPTTSAKKVQSSQPSTVNKS